MADDKRSTYGTTTAEPDQKVGVEVGGGEKAAHPGAKGDQADEEDRHEKRPEGPHADPQNTNPEATPGAGALPDGQEQDANGG